MDGGQDQDLRYWSNIYYQAGRYERLRDEGDVAEMDALDLLMCTEPRWPEVKAAAKERIDANRSETVAKAQAQPQADASIDLRMDKGQMLITIAGPDDHRSNEAVHFAHWVGRNLPALVSLAREDLLAQDRLMEQARAIAELVAKPVGPVIEAPVPRLVGSDGKLLQ